jgi:hypothetical protein
MKFFLARAKRILLPLWRGLREWSGDAAYERYLRSSAQSSGPALSEKQFYLDQLRRRYSRPSRCC